ncbi:MAG: U32 family peptidase, partial [Blautia sp.]|nr:U32 family peptidase [Blautia sp.]
MAGADAVYLGGDRFGARAYAKNFSQEELLSAIDLVHLMGKRLYLTVNTLVKNREMEDLPAYLAPLVEAGLDAVLVQDFGILSLLKRTFPSLDLHASTQMTVSGVEGIRLLDGLGVTRAVPARELSLEEIKKLCEASGMEIEVFIHGAMCYCYSGQCLFSSIAGGRSGNRGRCAQPCRLPMKVAARGNCTPLSMKDMMTLPLLPELYDAGVASLKIEGRMKQPAYVAGVTRIYRKYMDLLEEKGREGFRVEKADREELLSLYSRGGSCEGYYHRDHGKEMIFFTGGAKKGEGREEEPLPDPKLSVSGICTLKEGESASLTVWADNGRVSA